MCSFDNLAEQTGSSFIGQKQQRPFSRKQCPHNSLNCINIMTLCLTAEVLWGGGGGGGGSLQDGHGLWKTGKMVGKKSLQGKIREFEKMMKIGGKSGNLKKKILTLLTYI